MEKHCRTDELGRFLGKRAPDRWAAPRPGRSAAEIRTTVEDEDTAGRGE